MRRLSPFIHAVALFILVLIILASAIIGFDLFNKDAQPSLPQSVELRLDKYPVLPGNVRMDSSAAKKLGLRAQRLDRSLGVFVHYRYGADQRTDRESHWHYRVLKSGTAVDVDKSGRPWYLLADARRIYAAESGSGAAVSGAVIKAPAKASAPPKSVKQTPPPKKSSPDKGNGGFPWWVLGLFVVPFIVWWWLRRHRGDDGRHPYGADPDDDDLPGAQRPGVATDTIPVPSSGPGEGNFASRVGALEYRFDVLRSEVSEIRETVSGLEDRVVTRLEPIVKQAAEGGGKARAQMILAEQISMKAAEGDADMVASLTRVLESVSQ